jgi:hypothetical protein
MEHVKIQAEYSQPKYLYLYVVQGYYGFFGGWEDVYTGDTWADAQARLKEYRENEPKYIHRLINRREPNPEYAQ